MAYVELNPRRLLALLNRACAHCEARMRLALIEPSKPGRDKLIFECTECGREDSIEAKFRRAREVRSTRSSRGGLPAAKSGQGLILQRPRAAADLPSPLSAEGGPV